MVLGWERSGIGFDVSETADPETCKSAREYYSSIGKEGGPTMLQHVDVWRGIDRLAAKYGLSPSGLARRAGLDPTAFNPSKRITREGRPRWPSTESLSKVLGVTGESFSGFVTLTGAPGSGFDQPVGGGRIIAKNNAASAAPRALPVVAFSRVADGDCF